jgi:uncharacterized membrane protein
MSPWDPRAAMFAKHAQHLVIIHFPIALFIVGVAFDFIATWTRRKDLALVAYCNFYGALLAAVPTVLTGLLAGRRASGVSVGAGGSGGGGGDDDWVSGRIS